MEHAKNLYTAGAAIVGLRWDCVAALGNVFSFEKGSELANDSATECETDTMTTTPPSSCEPFSSEASQVRRKAKIERVTQETSIKCEMNLDGTGIVDCQSGIGFFDHMIHQLGKHGSFDIKLHCKGDIQVDDHHTIEDCAILLGQAVDQVSIKATELIHIRYIEMNR